jgi:hypothetical protein
MERINNEYIKEKMGEGEAGHHRYHTKQNATMV